MWQRIRSLFGNFSPVVAPDEPLPDAAEAEEMLAAGISRHQEGEIAGAEAIYRKVLALAPTHSAAANSLGILLAQRGDFRQAEQFLRSATLLDRDNPAFLTNLGNALMEQGRFQDAADAYRQSIEIQSLPESHNGLGNALQQLKQLDAALEHYGRAIALRPDFVEPHYNFGSVCQAQGKLDEAIDAYRKALALKPDLPEVCCNLGNALLAQAKRDEAIAEYRQAIALKPDYARAHSNLGVTLQAQGRLDDAVDAYRQALRFEPNHAVAHFNLGSALQAQGKLDEAIASYHRAIACRPDYADAHNNLAVALEAQGKMDAAAASFRQVLALRPGDHVVHSSLIFAIDLSAVEDSASHQRERRKWDEAHAARLMQRRPHLNTPDPERRLRIGYVSADIREHSASKVFGAMLAKFDPAQFEVFAYSNSPVEDPIAREFQQCVTHWRKIVDMPDDAVADMIRDDVIDILVDLSGHSAGSRLLVFARKPAPIQVTAWGYATSTGMRAMDVFFADPVIVPPEEKHLFTEDVRYLPNVVGSYFSQEFPAVGELPMLASGFPTFGSLNRLTKVSDDVLAAWAQVLSAVPGSRMVIKAVELEDQATRDRVTGFFVAAGIDRERIVLLGKTSWTEQMAAFNQIDIALDPFPHGGGVTTLESLMMGVPVVTLRWPTIVGRLSASILTTLGLSDWIAETPEQYVAVAAQKAQNCVALDSLRKQLRSIYSSSIIGDAQSYVRAVECEYRQLWREWCARQTADDKL